MWNDHMTIKGNELVKVWDDDSLIKENIDFLRTPTKPVSFPLSKQMQHIINDLIDTYRAVPCAGIAANQLGFDKKLFIGMKHDVEEAISDNPSKNIDDVKPTSDNYEIYINPQIDGIDKKSTQTGEESCLSIPFLTLELKRYDKIKVRYYDLNGQRIKKPLSRFLSRLYQHELDHLNGNLMLEHQNILNAEMWVEEEKYKNLSMKLMEYLNN